MSPAAVSRVLASTPVRPAYRARVLEVLGTTNDWPNLAARRLRSAAAGTIGLIIPDIGNPFFTRLVRAVEDAAWTRGLRVLVCNSDEEPERESAYLDLLREERVGGVLLAPTLRSAALAHALVRSTPAVLIDRVPEEAVQDGVHLDNAAAATQLAEALADRGCRAVLGLFSADSVTGAERRDGFEAATSRLHLPSRSALIPHAAAARSSSVAGALASWPACDGIVTSNSLILLSVAGSVRSRPAPVALATFDSADWHRLVPGGVTVLDQPAEAMGRDALALLVERMGGLSGPPRRRTLPGLLRGNSPTSG